MNLFRMFRLNVIVLFVCILAGCGGGGGEDGGGEPPVLPEYDLTGRWLTAEPVDCTTVSGDVPALLLAQVNSELELALLDEGLGTRVVQMGNDLEITSLDSGARADGNISGDQVTFAYSEQRMLGELDVDIYEEYEGTVLNANRIALTLEANLTLEAEGSMVTIGALCTFHAARTLL